MKKIIALSLRDLQNITRDAVLMMSILGPLILALTIKFVMPWIQEVVLAQLSYNLSQDFAFIMSFLILMVPMMIGMLTGFMILEERDEDLLTYFSVTPLSKSGYLIYRLISPIVISLILTLVLLQLTSLIKIDLLQLLPVILLASLGAPIIALFMTSFAQNKVEGLALGKISGILPFAALAAYFIKSNWQLLAGVFPSYWISKAFLLRNTKYYWFYLFLGLVVHLAYLKFFLAKFSKKIN